MRAASGILAITGLLSVGLFFALTVLSGAWIEPADLSLFDSRMAGYSVADARALLGALSAEQTALYLGIFRALDTAFPILLAVTLAGTIWQWTADRSIVLRVICVATAGLYLAMDLMENAAVSEMLRAGPQIAQSVIKRASSLTIAKWVSLAVTFGVVLLAGRARRARNAGAGQA